MAGLNELIERYGRLNLRADLPTLVQQTSYELLALDQEQMHEGINSKKDKISPSYKNAYYAKKKNEQNSAPGFGTPDLYKTGQMYKSLGFSIKGDSYDIEPTVDYGDDLIDKYGEEVFRVSDENKGIYANTVLKEAIKKRITEVTGYIFS